MWRKPVNTNWSVPLGNLTLTALRCRKAAKYIIQCDIQNYSDKRIAINS